MNSKLALDEYLLILKSTVEVYVHGTLESSNKDIKKLLEKCLMDTFKCQEDTYNMMVSYGYYKVNNVTNKVISTTLDKVISHN